MLRNSMLRHFFLICCLIASSSGIFRARLFLRLLCYNHPSSMQTADQPCDNDGNPCDPELVFCFYNATNRRTCNIGRFVFDFTDQTKLGDCLEPGRKNVPAPLHIELISEKPDLSFSLTINEVDKSAIFTRRSEIDQLSFLLLPSSLPILPNGQAPRLEDFVPITERKRRFLGPGRPQVKIGAVLQCPPNRFGAMCRVNCSASDKFGCQTNGTRECRPGWSGPDCSRRDFCSSGPCKEWAVCRPLPDGFECLCDGGKGPQCRRGGDPCLNNRCANGATCLGVGGRRVCICQPGWRGSLCQEVDPCQPSPCGPDGRCHAENFRPVCVCNPGWRGTFCNNSIPFASPAPENVPPETKKPLSGAVIFLLIFLGIILVAGAAISGRCIWQQRLKKNSEGDRDRERYPSLSQSVSTQRTNSTSPYDNRSSTEIHLTEEDVYEEPGPLYSVPEEEEGEVEMGEDAAFRSVSSEESPAPSRPRCVRYVRA